MGVLVVDVLVVDVLVVGVLVVGVLVVGVLVVGVLVLVTAGVLLVVVVLQVVAVGVAVVGFDAAVASPLSLSEPYPATNSIPVTATMSECFVILGRTVPFSNAKLPTSQNKNFMSMSYVLVTVGMPMWRWVYSSCWVKL